MNLGFVLLGACMACGSALLYFEFSDRNPRERRAAQIGFAMMGLAGVGAAVVGFFPENSIHVIHVAGAALAIGLGNVAIFVLGAVLTLPESMRRSMLMFSSMALTALLLFAAHKYFGIGAGTMERLAAYPETIWLITFGLYIWRFDPKANGVGAGD
jgi:hypothetical membrane protein